MDKIALRLLKKLNFLKHFNILNTISINDRNFKIPILGEIGFSNLIPHEPWMLDLLKIIIPIDKAMFVDVGTNIGQTLLKQKSISPKMPYIGFEPNSRCIHYINQLVFTNQIENCEIVPVGISNKTELGVLEFYSRSKDDPSATIIKNFRPSEQVFNREFVPLFHFEDIKNQINIERISILKIDVEGAELEVINSFKHEIEQGQPIILTEILPAYSTQMLDRIERQNNIQQILNKLLYSIFRVIIKNGQLVNIEEIEEIGIHSDLNSCEYVFIPKSKKEIFTTNFLEFLEQRNTKN